MLKAEASLSQAEWQAALRAHLYEVRAAVRERARGKVFRSGAQCAGSRVTLTQIPARSPACSSAAECGAVQRFLQQSSSSDLLFERPATCSKLSRASRLVSQAGRARTAEPRGTVQQSCTEGARTAERSRAGGCTSGVEQQRQQGALLLLSNQPSPPWLCHNHDSRTSPSVTQRKKGGATVTKCLDKLFSWRRVENFFSVNSAALSQVVTRVSSSPPPITWKPLAWSLCQFLRPSLFPAVPDHSEPSLWIHLNGAELVPTLSSLK